MGIAGTSYFGGVFYGLHISGGNAVIYEFYLIRQRFHHGITYFLKAQKEFTLRKHAQIAEYIKIWSYFCCLRQLCLRSSIYQSLIQDIKPLSLRHYQQE